MSESIGDKRYGCPECQAGVLHLEYIPYFMWLGDDLVIVPGFPAWVCDLCGRREYDPRAIQWLDFLMDAGSQNGVAGFAQYGIDFDDQPAVSSS